MFVDKRVLIVTPERLGDALMCTPAIHYLKSNYPTLKIDVFAYSELSAETLKNNPDIDNIFTNIEDIKKIYDFGIDIHGEPYLRAVLEKLNLEIYAVPPVDPSKHQAESELEYLKNLSPEKFEITNRHYRLFPSQADREHIQKIFAAHHVDPNKQILIGCQIGCHSIAKKKWAIFKKLHHPKIWPFEYFLDLGQRLQDFNPNIRLVLTGSNSEKVLGNKFIKEIPSAISFIDQTTVLQLRALLDEMDLFISPDTGVMHVACSADIPLIALFGPTNLTRTGPYPTLKNLQIIRAEKMEDITVDQVFNAVIQKISHHL